jgi:hypothetical protein
VVKVGCCVGEGGVHGAGGRAIGLPQMSFSPSPVPTGDPSYHSLHTFFSFFAPSRSLFAIPSAPAWPFTVSPPLATSSAQRSARALYPRLQRAPASSASTEHHDALLWTARTYSQARSPQGRRSCPQQASYSRGSKTNLKAIVQHLAYGREKAAGH